jgi:hypothetical protein
MTATTGNPHPIVGFARAVGTALDKVGACEPAFMSTAEKKAALVELHRVEQRLVALRLRVMAVAGDVADEEATRDVAAWLAFETRAEPGAATAELRLGESRDRSWHHLSQALGAGRVNVAQARVIARALAELPDDLEPEQVARAEEHLVALAADYRPRLLKRLGRHLLEVVAPEAAEAEEGRRLGR